MADLLEFLLSLLLEVVGECLPWEYLWRFFLPVLAAFGLFMLIRLTIANSTVQALLGAPVMVAGVAWGIVWQRRNG